MKVIAVYLRIYRACLAQALRGIGRNLWTLLLPIALLFAFTFLIVPLLAPLGAQIGGILIALVLDALFSCYLYFTGEVVAHSRVSIKDFKKSIGAYFWSIANLFFLIWILNLVLQAVFEKSPDYGLITGLVWLAMAIFLNPSPEIIYVRGTRGGLETVQYCVKFIQEQWLEWFAPNLLLLGAAWVFLTMVLPFLGALALIPVLLFGGALFHVVMVFRGHLFQELDGSSHRQRMFRYRNEAQN